MQRDDETESQKMQPFKRSCSHWQTSFVLKYKQTRKHTSVPMTISSLKFQSPPNLSLVPGWETPGRGLKPEKVIPAGLRLIGQVPLSPNHYWFAHTLLLTVVPLSNRFSRLHKVPNPLLLRRLQTSTGFWVVGCFIISLQSSSSQ